MQHGVCSINTVLLNNGIPAPSACIRALNICCTSVDAPRNPDFRGSGLRVRIKVAERVVRTAQFEPALLAEAKAHERGHAD